MERDSEVQGLDHNPSTDFVEEVSDSKEVESSRSLQTPPAGLRCLGGRRQGRIWKSKDELLRGMDLDTLMHSSSDSSDELMAEGSPDTSSHDIRADDLMSLTGDLNDSSSSGVRDGLRRDLEQSLELGDSTGDSFSADRTLRPSSPERRRVFYGALDHALHLAAEEKERGVDPSQLTPARWQWTDERSAALTQTHSNPPLMRVSASASSSHTPASDSRGAKQKKKKKKKKARLRRPASARTAVRRTPFPPSSARPRQRRTPLSSTRTQTTYGSTSSVIPTAAAMPRSSQSHSELTEDWSLSPRAIAAGLRHASGSPPMRRRKVNATRPHSYSQSFGTGDATAAETTTAISAMSSSLATMTATPSELRSNPYLDESLLSFKPYLDESSGGASMPLLSGARSSEERLPRPQPPSRRRTTAEPLAVSSRTAVIASPPLPGASRRAAIHSLSLPPPIDVSLTRRFSRSGRSSTSRRPPPLPRPMPPAFDRSSSGRRRSAHSRAQTLAQIHARRSSTGEIRLVRVGGERGNGHALESSRPRTSSSSGVSRSSERSSSGSSARPGHRRTNACVGQRHVPWISGSIGEHKTHRRRSSARRSGVTRSGQREASDGPTVRSSEDSRSSSIRQELTAERLREWDKYTPRRLRRRGAGLRLRRGTRRSPTTGDSSSLASLPESSDSDSVFANSADAVARATAIAASNAPRRGLLELKESEESGSEGRLSPTDSSVASHSSVADQSPFLSYVSPTDYGLLTPTSWIDALPLSLRRQQRDDHKEENEEKEPKSLRLSSRASRRRRRRPLPIDADSDDVAEEHTTNDTTPRSDVSGSSLIVHAPGMRSAPNRVPFTSTLLHSAVTQLPEISPLSVFVPNSDSESESESSSDSSDSSSTAAMRFDFAAHAQVRRASDEWQRRQSLSHSRRPSVVVTDSSRFLSVPDTGRTEDLGPAAMPPPAMATTRVSVLTGMSHSAPSPATAIGGSGAPQRGARRRRGVSVRIPPPLLRSGGSAPRIPSVPRPNPAEASLSLQLPTELQLSDEEISSLEASERRWPDISDFTELMARRVSATNHLLGDSDTDSDFDDSNPFSDLPSIARMEPLLPRSAARRRVDASIDASVDDDEDTGLSVAARLRRALRQHSSGALEPRHPAADSHSHSRGDGESVTDRLQRALRSSDVSAMELVSGSGRLRSDARVHWAPNLDSDLSDEDVADDNGNGDLERREHESECDYLERVVRASWNGSLEQLPTREIDEAESRRLEEAGEKCTICLSDFEAGTVCRRLLCGHEFCKDCIDNWFQTPRGGRTCPLCKFDHDPPRRRAFSRSAFRSMRTAFSRMPSSAFD